MISSALIIKDANVKKTLVALKNRTRITKTKDHCQVQNSCSNKPLLQRATSKQL